MSSCTSCGAQLGVGRFCTNCGAPVDSSTPDGTPVSTPVTPGDWRTDTAERKLGRPGGDPRTPPAAVAPPPPPRYPLYADEVPGWSPYGPLVTSPAQPPAAAPPADAPLAGAGPDDPEPLEWADYEDEDYYEDERRSPLLWIISAVVVLALVAAGWWFLVRDDGTGSARDPAAGTGQSAEGAQTGTAEGVDVAGSAAAEAPKTAPPNEDVNGDQISYDASNMLDGVPDTAWRTAGDASGMALTFTLREPTELSRVGLVNGYAKTSTDEQGRTFDWYLGNRRIETVVWIFDDGTKLRQQLQETRELQTIDVDPAAATSRVVLKIMRVSAPGDGTAARDFTAISEVSLVGVPQG